MLVQAREWLEDKYPYLCKADWYWNPRQTGTADEPDLLARQGDTVLISAEATTSESPIGAIDDRMRKTLSKLSEAEGQLYYFVCTPKMSKRAMTKRDKENWNIKVVEINGLENFK